MRNGKRRAGGYDLRSTRPTRQRGAILLLVLVWMSILPLLLLAAADGWEMRLRHERETELLFIGGEFARALASYQNSHPSGASPASLDDLLRDRRGLVERHHLRRLYYDPITGRNTWGLKYAPDKRIEGIYSLSDQAPLKQAGFPKALQGLEKKSSYRDWVFRADMAP